MGNHNPLLPRLRSKPALNHLITLDIMLVMPSLLMSSNSLTTLKLKEPLSNKKLLLILDKKNRSTNNTLLPGTTRRPKSISTKTPPPEIGLSLRVTRKPSLVTGLMLKPLIFKPDKNSRKTSSTSRDLLLPRKLLSKPPLKLNGQPNFKLTEMPLSNSTSPWEDHKTELP